MDERNLEISSRLIIGSRLSGSTTHPFRSFEKKKSRSKTRKAVGWWAVCPTTLAMGWLFQVVHANQARRSCRAARGA